MAGTLSLTLVMNRDQDESSLIMQCLRCRILDAVQGCAVDVV